MLKLQAIFTLGERWRESLVFRIVSHYFVLLLILYSKGFEIYSVCQDTIQGFKQKSKQHQQVPSASETESGWKPGKEGWANIPAQRLCEHVGRGGPELGQ